MSRGSIIVAIPQLSNGGAERVASIWANELVARSYDVTVLLFHRSKGEYALDPAVKCVSLADDIFTYGELSFWSKFRKLRRALTCIKPNCLISFLPSMQVWCMIASVGLGIHRIDTIRINPWKISVTNPFKRFLWKLSYATCKHIIIQATGQTEFFPSSWRQRITLIPNPLSRIYSTVYKTHYQNVAKEFIAVGRIEPQKNYPMMIRGFANAVKKYPYIRLSVFGSGPDDYVDELQSYIDAVGMNAHICLRGRSRCIEGEYISSDSFIMTSDFEGLPNALIEAMACGLVCMSTDCKTGPRDLIDDGKNGFLIKVGDADALTYTICRVVEMTQEDRIGFGKAAREKIIEYCSLEHTVDTLCQLLK